MTDLHLEHSTEPLNLTTDHTVTPSLPVTISDDNLNTSGDVLPEGIDVHIEQQSSNDQDRAELLRCNPPSTSCKIIGLCCSYCQVPNYSIPDLSKIITFAHSFYYSYLQCS